jgi:hypothetical protein
MNRIERLIWEETQLKEIERSTQGSRGSRGTKVLSIAVLAGVVALVAFGSSVPRLDESVTRALAPSSIVYSPAARPNDAGSAGNSAAASPRNAADRATRNK